VPTKDGVYGLAFRQTEAEEAGVWQDIFNYVYGFGGAWSDGKNLTINSPANLKGLQAYKDLYDANVIPRGADAATFRRMFAEGKVGMELNNGGYVTATRGQNPKLKFSIAPIPFPVRKQGAILAPIVINEASPAKEEAATFIRWVLEPRNQVKLQEILGASSVATTTKRSAESLKQTPLLTTFDELTASSLPQVLLGFEAKTPDIRKVSGGCGCVVPGCGRAAELLISVCPVLVGRRLWPSCADHWGSVRSVFVGRGDRIDYGPGHRS
jgi:multiple sugar transport system substrate-binding protein